ncbi:hypothetical protein CRUP_033885 [Coryphaenoides rupestris]|nr:hypothetical protein CRUP_033885 [Coryphaenoides rupestris]
MLLTAEVLDRVPTSRLQGKAVRKAAGGGLQAEETFTPLTNLEIPSVHLNLHPTGQLEAPTADMCKGLTSLPNSCLERAKGLKARLGSILQKPDWKLTCCKIGKNRPTPQECLKWKHSFEQLLSNGLCAFTAFLVSEFSEENIAFYFACEEYRSTKSTAKLGAKAQKIYDEFIGSDAPREINIDHETRDITKSNMASPSPSCFDMAQHRIYMLMAKDCYPRFLRSQTFREMAYQDGEHKGRCPVHQENV